jgi:hypothetical protein
MGSRCATLTRMTDALQSLEAFADDIVAALASWSNAANLDAKTVRELVGVTFYASLEVEEGRSCTFSLAYLGDQRLLHWSNQHHWCPSVFGETLPLSIPAVAKLSPACDPEQTHIAIGGADGKLTILGVVRTNRDTERFARGERHSMQSVSDSFLVLLAHAPGVLEARINTARIALLSRGVRLEHEVELFSSGWLSERITAYAAAAKLDANQFGATLRSILQHLVRRGCGGTVILLQDEHDGLEIKYEFKSPSNAIGDGIRFAMRHTAATASSNETGRPRLVDSYLLLSDVASFGGDLASVDGALVLNPDLSIRGFGAKIICHQPDEVPAQLAKDTAATSYGPSPLSMLGTRHSSAARFCYNHVGAVCFVVSQDRTVSCLMRRSLEEPVLVWRPVLLEWYQVVASDHAEA